MAICTKNSNTEMHQEMDGKNIRKKLYWKCSNCKHKIMVPKFIQEYLKVASIKARY